MHIQIDVGEFFDWEPYDGTPTEDEIKALLVKPASNGGWLEKVVVEQPSHTAININDAEIKDCQDAFARKGRVWSRARVVAWYLEEQVMQHHAPQTAWTNIHVLDEPEVEAELKRFFNIGGK